MSRLVALLFTVAKGLWRTTCRVRKTSLGVHHHDMRMDARGALSDRAAGTFAYGLLTFCDGVRAYARL